MFVISLKLDTWSKEFITMERILISEPVKNCIVAEDTHDFQCVLAASAVRVNHSRLDTVNYNYAGQGGGALGWKN